VIADAVYVLCAVTSIACAVLLFRGFLETRTRLLFWSSLCFAGLALNNVLLLVDLFVVPDIDLGLLRSGTALIALAVLLVGLVGEDR
jgi:hypothetical protein